MDYKILENITVIEMGTAIAGPYSGKVFADYGAEVIKVEPRWGDNYRNRPGWYSDPNEHEFTHKFLQYNTNKKSISVDLKSDEGVSILEDLIAEADVLIENMRTGVLTSMGFPWEEIRKLNSGLIYCSITGFGESGPYKDFPAYEQAMQGITAWVHQSGKGERPEMLLLPGIDHLTSLYATIGVFMALIDRGITDQGQKIEVSMLESAISVLGHHWAEYSYCANNDVDPMFTGSMAPEGVFTTADGYMSMVVVPEHWEAFCEAIDRSEFADENHEFATLERRFDRQDELQQALDDILESKSTVEWMEFFSDIRGTVCAPVNHITDLPDDPQITHRDSVHTLDHPVMGEYLMAAPVIRLSRCDETLEHAPALGEHTNVILETLGYSDEQITRLHEEGTVR